MGRELKITSGLLRSRVLRGSLPDSVRPSTTRNRQAVFNILGNNLAGFSFLDGYAGSGIMGFEAFSRGAERVTWVDADARLVRRIENNARFLGLPSDRTAFFPMPFERALGMLKGQSFHLIYLDPPFPPVDQGSTAYLAAALGIQAGGLLAAEGRLIVEHPAALTLSLEEAGFSHSDTRHYGRVAVSFFGHAVP